MSRYKKLPEDIVEKLDQAIMYYYNAEDNLSSAINWILRNSNRHIYPLDIDLELEGALEALKKGKLTYLSDIIECFEYFINIPEYEEEY